MVWSGKEKNAKASAEPRLPLLHKGPYSKTASALALVFGPWVALPTRWRMSGKLAIEFPIVRGAQATYIGDAPGAVVFVFRLS